MAFFSIQVTSLKVLVRPTSLWALNCYYIIQSSFKLRIWQILILHGDLKCLKHAFFYMIVCIWVWYICRANLMLDIYPISIFHKRGKKHVLFVCNCLKCSSCFPVLRGRFNVTELSILRSLISVPNLPFHTGTLTLPNTSLVDQWYKLTKVFLTIVMLRFWRWLAFHYFTLMFNQLLWI